MATKVVLLQREPILHYRVSVYNYLARNLSSNGYDLTVVAESIQRENPYPVQFKYIRAKVSPVGILRKLWSLTPDVVIIFLRLRDWAIWPLLINSRIRGLPVLTWRHAIDLSQPRNIFKNKMYSLIDSLSKGIILYAKQEISYVSSQWRNKVSIANNTLNFEDFPEIIRTKDQIRSAWDIPYSKIVLFAGRIQPRKRLDLLVEFFELGPPTGVGLVIVGPDIPTSLLSRVEDANNMMYFGAIYDPLAINELFKAADVFCIPGAVGLAISQAFYWGLPLITMKNGHGPEIVYVQQGENGYLTNGPEELFSTLKAVLNDDGLRKRLSDKARITARTEASIERMAAGFVQALSNAMI